VRGVATGCSGFNRRASMPEFGQRTRPNRPLLSNGQGIRLPFLHALLRAPPQFSTVQAEPRLRDWRRGIRGFSARRRVPPNVADYLVRSRIVGIDIEEKHCKHLGRRVDLVRADQSDESQLAAVVETYGRPDVVIDDGSHIGEHIITSFSTFFPLLRVGGFYVIEDLNTGFLPDFGGSIPPGERSGVGLVRTLAESAQSLDVSFPSFWNVQPRPPHSLGWVPSKFTPASSS
jgi:hypothetical protein